jgi:hypothetical protein
MAQIDADGLDYVSLAALRAGNGDQSRPLTILQYGLSLCADWPGRRPLMILASEK